MQNEKRTADDFYRESKRLRKEVLQMADALKYSPLRFTITNEITMEVENTKSDLKTIIQCHKECIDKRYPIVLEKE